ncbi:MAG: hypothetical protein EOP19_31335, partial [Hyphomicrobiales bacterium]
AIRGLPGWTTQTFGFGEGRSELAVSWRSDEFELVRARQRVVATGVGWDVGRYPFGTRLVAVVTLRHRATDRTLTVINTHLPQAIEELDRLGSFTPTINSYRRYDRGAWSPEDVSWGYENRTAAIRAITTPTPSACRFENRVPGADVNPYLTVAAMIASGTEGIEDGLVPPPAEAGMAAEGNARRLHANLTDAAQAFAASDFCARAFGTEFRDHYAASRLNEVAAFEHWKTQRITDFEWQRYFI